MPAGKGRGSAWHRGRYIGLSQGPRTLVLPAPPLSPCRRELLKEVPDGQTPNVELGSVRKQKKS